MSKGIRLQERTCRNRIDWPQESEKRARQSTGRDQANSECTAGNRTVHGSDRSKVGYLSHTHIHAANSRSTGIVQSSTGSNYVVRILSTLDREQLKPSSSVALHRHSNSLVDILPPEADSSIAMLGADEKPDVTYADVGGLDMQKQEIREAVELPLTHFDLYKQIGTSFSSRSTTSADEFRYRPTTRRITLRSARNWQDHACQGCCQQHDS